MKVHTPIESALVIPVGVATPVVAPWRERLDAAAVHGVPAHVTVLYPFVPPPEITDDHIAGLAQLFSSFPPFDFVLERVGWFDTTVVYLAPEPDDPFIRLTELVVARFPDYPPYGGEFAELTPHLTVGDRGSPSELRAAADAVAPALPIAARATEVWLMVGSANPGAWRVRTRFQLGGGAPAAAG